jgi:GT2 family glycosyltransferase
MDYCRRVRDAGWHIYYLASASIVHFGRSSINQHEKQGWQRQAMFQSFWLYRLKHSGRFSAAYLSIAMAVWAAISLLAITPLLAIVRSSSSVHLRLSQMREIAYDLLRWSLTDKVRFEHPLAKAASGVLRDKGVAT